MPQLATSFRHPVGDGSVTRARDGDGYYTSQGHGSYYAGHGYHLGEDWNGDGGGNTDLRDPVYAAANGRVVFAGNGGTGWGNVVIIQHTMPDGSTVSTLYGHLDRINVSAGDVTIGQQIGTIGTGGGLYAAHLHFEVYLGSMSRPGDGYSSSPDPDPFTHGYVNPTRFIDSHRTIVTDIPGSSATTAVLTLGELQRSSIETVGDSDWFKVYLVAGQSYSFAVRGNEFNNGNLNDPKIRLRGPDETILITRDNGGGDRDARITGFTATESGYYYVTAYSADGGTGSYTIRAIQSTTTSDIAGSTATTSTLAPGGSASSTIATSGDQDWFRISLTAGQTYTFTQNAASGSDLDCYLRLLNSSGTQLTYSDDDGPGNNSLITFTATSSGTYYLSAQGYDTSTGGYTISVSSGSAARATSASVGLSEASSADLLSGGSGSPALWGGRGGDLLRGDFGDAGLGEGGGSDVFAFLFGFGSDRTIGSDDPEGSLHLFPARSAGGMTAQQIAESIAAAHSGANAFEPGDGHRIALNGVGTLAALADDLVFA